MPPKKVNKTAKKAVQVKTPRRRTKNVSQIETEDRAKRPQQNSTNDEQNKDRVVLLTKNDINIMLANEVVARQFPKKSTLSKDPANEVVSDLLKTTKTKPILKRKKLLKNKVPNEESTCEENPSKKNIKHALVVKKFKIAPNKVQKSVPKKKQNESVPGPRKNETKKLGRSKVVPKKKPVPSNATTNEDLEIKPKTARRKLSLIRKPVTSGPRTRKQAGEVTKVAEPVVSPEKKENNEIINTNVKEQDIISRSQSAASLSELSWTKDILSSSTTTCATVSSKDFFRIDNKIVSLNHKPVTTGPRTRKQASEVTKVAEPVVSPEKKENNEIINTNAKEQDIISRSQSEASLSELSWTKDISSSSTTTCATVSSKDFFRIDNKIPILKLKNINWKLKNEENNNLCGINKKHPTITVSIQFDNVICEKSAIEHCDKNSEDEKRNERYEDEVNFNCTQLVSNLSTSSSDSNSDEEKSTKSDNPTAMNKLNDTLEKLFSKNKMFDLEIINWIEWNDNENIDPNIEKVQQKIYQDNLLKEETDVIYHCQCIKRILSENSQTTDAEPVKSGKCNVHTDFENAMSNENIDESHNNIERNYNSFNESNFQEGNVGFDQIEPSKEKDLAINLLTDGNCFDDDDEDDTLSLYAESITGIESSTKNSKFEYNVNHLNEEYVPQPISNNKFKSPETIKYHPTKIIKEKLLETPQNTSLGNVCEKQNADSTSIYKEQDNFTSFQEKNASNENNELNENQSRTQNNVTKIIPKSPILMESIYKQINGVTSIVFNGICFFNLISKCKKNMCKFPHISLEVDAVKNKLLFLSNTTFIQEYMLLRCWLCLRLKYGMCFVEECIRRKLTRIVVEMALDFIHTSKKINVIDIVETILLYLNSVDLCICEDILMIKIRSTAFLLCDFFINTIAESQNFSRFKNVFVNLTDFMYRNGKTFSADVAAQVLERIVILPYDEGLARALIKIIKNTEACIFSNPMIGHLEQHLMRSNMELYDEFHCLKDQVLQKRTILENCYPNTTQNDVDKPNVNLNYLDKDKRYSPDTTNLDHLNKTTMEPKFTRTIDLKKINFLNVNGHMSNSSSWESEDRRFTPKNQFKNWRGRKSNDNMRHTNRNPLMRPPLRPPFKRRSDQAFGGSPSKFQRRGFNFFKDFS